jgi:hypothetical protein
MLISAISRGSQVGYLNGNFHALSTLKATKRHINAFIDNERGEVCSKWCISKIHVSTQHINYNKREAHLFTFWSKEEVSCDSIRRFGGRTVIFIFQLIQYISQREKMASEIRVTSETKASEQKQKTTKEAPA